MVYCRGCGKEIHESATMCPQCGYQYIQPKKKNEENFWLALVSSILTLMILINWFEVWHKDLRIGLLIFSFVTIALSAIALKLKHSGEAIHKICIGVAIATMLMLMWRNI
jgi:hypothetical protein